MGKGLLHISGRSKDDDIYLSYQDTCLKRGDVNTLKEDDWLTDTVISFWEDYLEHEKLSIEFPTSKIILLRPPVSHILLRTPTEQIGSLSSALPPLNEATHMFLTVNDNKDPDSLEGGTHWSLLVVSLIDDIAFHYDSLTPTNADDAALLTYHLSLVTNKQIRMLNIAGTPQQTNGVDCGVHVCLMIQHLLFGKLLNQTSDQPINMSLADNEIDAAVGRKEMLKVIESMRRDAKKKENRGNSPFRSGFRSSSRVGDETPK